MLEQGSSLLWDDSELVALREQVKKLSSEKAALQEKNKKLSKAKKGWSLSYVMQSTRLFCLVFISLSFNRVHSLHQIIKDWGKLGTGSKDSYVPKADEIEKLKRFKEDSDQEMAMMLQQLKTLSESRDLMQQKLQEHQTRICCPSEVPETPLNCIPVFFTRIRHVSAN